MIGPFHPLTRGKSPSTLFSIPSSQRCLLTPAPQQNMPKAETPNPRPLTQTHLVSYAWLLTMQSDLHLRLLFRLGLDPALFSFACARVCAPSDVLLHTKLPRLPTVPSIALFVNRRALFLSCRQRWSSSSRRKLAASGTRLSARTKRYEGVHGTERQS